MSRQVVINQDECIGCETCVDLCPEVFGFNPDLGKAYVLSPEGGSEDEVQEAIDSCPCGMHPLG